MAGHDLLGRRAQLLLFVAQFFEGAAPLLRGITGQFAAVDGEGVPADQIQFAGVQQHIGEHVRHFLVHLRHEVRDRGEVRAGVGGKRHELDIPFAGLRQFAARDEAFVVSVQHDLEQHGRVVGQPAGFLIGVTRRKRREVDVLIDDLVQGVFEGTWQDLIAE